MNKYAEKKVVTSNALELIRSKIPAKKARKQPVKEGKTKPKTKRLWNDDEALLLTNNRKLKSHYITLSLRNIILK